MLVKITGHEITDAEIEKVSLVKRGAIRQPFKIVKAEDPVAFAVDATIEVPMATRVNEEAAPNPMDPKDGVWSPDIHPDRVGLAAVGNTPKQEDVDFMFGSGSAFAFRNRNNPIK